MNEVRRHDPAAKRKRGFGGFFRSSHKVGKQIGGVIAVVVHHYDLLIGWQLKDRRNELGRRSVVVAIYDLERRELAEEIGNLIGALLSLRILGDIETNFPGRERLSQQRFERILEIGEATRNRGQTEDRIRSILVGSPHAVEIPQAGPGKPHFVQRIVNECLAFDEIVEPDSDSDSRWNPEPEPGHVRSPKAWPRSPSTRQGRANRARD